MADQKLTVVWPPPYPALFRVKDYRIKGQKFSLYSYFTFYHFIGLFQNCFFLSLIAEKILVVLQYMKTVLTLQILRIHQHLTPLELVHLISDHVNQVKRIEPTILPIDFDWFTDN